jgi:carbohydrate diacid regulator
MNDVSVFVNSITQRTGINFSVYDLSGNLVAGVNTFFPKENIDFDGILIDTEKNLTFFELKIRGKRHIGCLFGSSEVQKNYAYLIAEFAEAFFGKEAGLSRSEFLRSVLLGEISFSQTSRYKRKFEINDALAFVMYATLDNKPASDAITILKTYINSGSGEIVPIDDGAFALIKYVDEETGAYQSANEYAEFLVRVVYEETGARLKITIGGTVETVLDLSKSYTQALTASRVSLSVGSRGSVHSFKEYVLIKVLEDLPKLQLGEYLDMLVDQNAREILDDPEMIATADEFLENSLNMSETSRKLYLHRNTLAYRLDKIEKATGLNVRKFADAVTFRLITILSKLVK